MTKKTEIDGVRIRDANAGDILAMVALLGQLFSMERDFRPDPDRQARGLALLLKQPGAHGLVAERAGRVVGMITVQRLVSTAEGAPVGLVEDLVVEETHRAMGIGRRLLEAMEIRARESGLARLQLLADRDNLPALDFYRRNAWNTTSLIVLRHPGR